MENRFWYKLLQEKLKTGTGLTLPFLIGSQYILNFDKPISIPQLIAEMIAFNQMIVLKYCHQTKEYIFTLDKNLGLGYYKNKITLNNLTVIADNSFLVGVEEYEHIIETFELYYSQNINKNEFSKIVTFNDERWRIFDQKEIEFIKNTI